MAESKTNSRRLLLIPIGIGLIFGLLNLFSYIEISPGEKVLPGWTGMDNAVYDLFLYMKPPIAQDPSLVLLNIDNEAIDMVGTYPWPRGRMAEGLEALAEFNAAYAIFDIEYINESPRSVNQTYLDVTLKTHFDENFRDIKSSIYDLFTAVSQKSISLADLPTYTDDLSAQVGSVADNLYADVKRVAAENDTQLGLAMRFFGHSFVTLNMQPVPVERPKAIQDLPALARERFQYNKIAGIDKVWSKNRDFLIPIKPILSMATGAGSTNVDRDKDGKLRRIRLLNNVDGAVYAQLALRPYLDSLGNPTVIAESDAVILKDVIIKGQKQDVRIPVDDKGQMLINWPNNTFDNTFLPSKTMFDDGKTDDKWWHQPSFYRLIEYKDNEQEIAAQLSALAGKNAWNLLPVKNPIRQVLAIWNDTEALRQTSLESGSAEDKAAFLLSKEDYYAVLEELVGSPIDTQLIQYLRDAQAADKKSNAKLYAEMETSLIDAFKTVRELVANQMKLRANLQKLLNGAYCVIGWTATASTDFGVTPFDNKYANVGTHTSVLNTIIQQKFLWSAPWWVSSFLSVGLAFGLVFLVQRMKTGAQIIVGISATVATFAALFLVFMITGMYIWTLAPVLSVFLSFLFFVLSVFFMTEQEKSFLRKAFSTYLSSDVIEQIVKDPASLKLGGQKKWISAMFTDVKGFSTVSEQLAPEQLVKLLNFYLSGMSDIILENRGTIDKFEGDAIISFFGAPIDYANHAEFICRSAILMKRKEKELNIRFLAEDMSPTPLLTRIGINTGEMVVGNMGTERKMDYTIMGNAVNLAARLEGVNKQYGSWILATESTKNEAGDSFAWRRLDRVRVVGINQPLRLYELVDFKADLSPDMLSLLAGFDAALDIFEARQWSAAVSAFSSLVEANPLDGPSKVYLKRSKEFMENAPSPEWEGVFNLTEK